MSKVIEFRKKQKVSINSESKSVPKVPENSYSKLLTSWLCGNLYVYVFDEHCTEASCTELTVTPNDKAILKDRDVSYKCKKIEYSLKNCSFQLVSKIGIVNLFIILPDLFHSYIGGMGSIQKPATGSLKFPTAYKCILSRVPFSDPVSSFGMFLRAEIPDEYRIYKMIQKKMASYVQENRYPLFSEQVSKDLGGINFECYQKLLKVSMPRKFHVV